NVADRPTADDVVAKISNLCFIGVDRKVGSVTNLIQNGYSGFIDGDDGVTTFFSRESVYGSKSSAMPGKRVCYSNFPGSPRDRGHPIIVIE
ncbi:TPA: serine/threonine protein kinase, partial [Pseudomonas aeruginosa]